MIDTKETRTRRLNHRKGITLRTSSVFSNSGCGILNNFSQAKSSAMMGCIGDTADGLQIPSG